MTRILTEGFEIKDGLFWTSTGSLVLSTTARSGNFSHNLTSAAHWTYKLFPGGGAFSEFYIRVGFRFASASNDPSLIQWRKGTTVLGSIRIDNATKLLQFYTSTTTFRTAGTIPLVVNTWYLLEVHVKIHDTTGVLECKIDGTIDTPMTFSGDTKPGSDTTIDGLYFPCQNNASLFYDDFAVNSTAGAADNAWCGEGRIEAIYPDEDGDASEFVNSDGDSIANWSYVDEDTPDGDGSYVQSATSGKKDLYGLKPGSFTDKDILRVYWEGRVCDTVAAGGTFIPLLKTTNEYAGDAQGLLTTYAQYKGIEYLVNPYTTAAWTPEELAALQAGIKVP